MPTFATLVGLGASRAVITAECWWKAGFETCAVGIVVALTAHLAGMAAAAVGAG